MPLDVGEFYLRHLLPCVPPGKRIDMKKTKYKKFAKFLKEVNSLESTPIVVIDDKKKGSEKIVEVTESIFFFVALSAIRLKPLAEIVVGTGK